MVVRMFNKGCLSSSGILWVERSGRLIQQYCCFRGTPCTDTCPKMMEPFEGLSADNKVVTTILKICGNYTLEFKEFEDNRGKKDEDE